MFVIYRQSLGLVIGYSGRHADWLGQGRNFANYQLFTLHLIKTNKKSNINKTANFFPIPRHEKAAILKTANIY